MPFQIVDRLPDEPWDAVVQAAEEDSEEGLSAAQIVPNKDYGEYAHVGTIAPFHYTLTLETPRSCRYTIQTPLPQRFEVFSGAEIIRHCYKSALQIVHDFGLEKVAFPLIGAEREGCPKELALQIATEEITKFLEDHEETDILLVVLDKRIFCPNPGLLSGLSEYIRRVREEERRIRAREDMLENASTGAFPAITAEDIEAARRRKELTVMPTDTNPTMPSVQAPRESSAKPPKGGVFSRIWQRKGSPQSPPPPSPGAAEGHSLPYPFETVGSDHASVNEESSVPSPLGSTGPVSPTDEGKECCVPPVDFGSIRPDFSSADKEEAQYIPQPYIAPEHTFKSDDVEEAGAPFDPDRRFVLDESFSQMVMRKIDEKGFKKDSDCYSRANITKQLFSKLRCDINYHPKKTTAVALAFALELTLSETKELLLKAGYSLSRSILFDVIVEYCILKRIYNVYIVNEMLFEYDQPLLGS